MKLLPIVLILLLAGCNSMTPEYKKVALMYKGMPKQQILNEFGPPSKTVSHGSMEILYYQLADTRPTFADPHPLKTEHYIIINHGRVECFGKQ